MRAFVICLVTVGLIVFSAKARADGGDKQSSETAEGKANPAPIRMRIGRRMRSYPRNRKTCRLR